MKKILHGILPILDMLFLPFVYPAGWLLKGIRQAGIHRLPLCKKALLYIGVFPVRNHYYEPQFDYRSEPRAFTRSRHLPGMDWNVQGQLELLSRFHRTKEFAETLQRQTGSLVFHFDNGTFESGDAEYWYQLIREVKPKRIIEIGSGNSTLIANMAIEKNREEDAAYACEHVCVEPFEMAWLEKTGVQVIREKVENLDLSFFSELQENDILFIDSSHMIRPHGDVLFEYLELLPSLARGVIVHVHDIFSPNNYPAAWLKEKVLFWNEQYLLEAFLSHNTSWKILGALNYLHHNHYDKLKAVAPYLEPHREPGSFYMQKTT